MTLPLQVDTPERSAHRQHSAQKSRSQSDYLLSTTSPFGNPRDETISQLMRRHPDGPADAALAKLRSVSPRPGQHFGDRSAMTSGGGRGREVLGLRGSPVGGLGTRTPGQRQGMEDLSSITGSPGLSGMVGQARTPANRRSPLPRGTAGSTFRLSPDLTSVSRGDDRSGLPHVSFNSTAEVYTPKPERSIDAALMACAGLRREELNTFLQGLSDRTAGKVVSRDRSEMVDAKLRALVNRWDSHREGMTIADALTHAIGKEVGMVNV